MGANYKFYIPQPNKDTDKMVEELYGAYISNTRKMDWLFSNLDSRNVIEAASVKADWVYAGTVLAENIIGTYITGKTIRTAASGSTRLELSTGNTLSAYTGATLTGTMSLWSTGIYLNTNSSASTVSIQSGAGYTGLVGGGVSINAGGSAAVDVYTSGNVVSVAGSSFTWGGATVATQTWVNTNANTDANTGSDTTGSHNHGIANGTKLAIDGGGSVTWAVFAGDAHTHSMS